MLNLKNRTRNHMSNINKFQVSGLGCAISMFSQTITQWNSCFKWLKVSSQMESNCEFVS